MEHSLPIDNTTYRPFTEKTKTDELAELSEPM